MHSLFPWSSSRKPLKLISNSCLKFPDFEEDEQHSHKAKISKDNQHSTDKSKLDRLKDAQLWNPNPHGKEFLTQASIMEVQRRRRSAFRSYQRKESVDQKNAKASSSTPVSSAARASVTKENVGRVREAEKQTQRKQRLSRTQELHKLFLEALQMLGGPGYATPKHIRELMKVDEVRNHLQGTFLFHNEKNMYATGELTTVTASAMRLWPYMTTNPGY